MIELVQHIEYLLLENDCVIVPGFGGFVAHHAAAKWIEEEGLFLPPTRTIGFNPQLKMNDGLLVQSYMETYNTGFPDASRLVEKATAELIGLLRMEGKLELHGIGELSLTIHDTYEFRPYEDGTATPELYGLSSFEMTELKTLAPAKVEEAVTPARLPQKEVYEIKINRAFLRHTVAAAAAIIIFFFLSTPVENTYVEKENYARMLSLDMFEAIHTQAIKTNTLFVENMQKAEKKEVKTSYKTTSLKPKAVRTEKVEKIPAITASIKKESKKTSAPVAVSKPQTSNESKVSSPKYHVIIASVANISEAQKAVENFKKQGYANANIIEGNGRIRISLISFSDRGEAYRKIAEIKQNTTFKDAWLLSTK